MAIIRPKDKTAATSVAAGDIFLIDGTTGVRALAASLVPLTNSANTFTAAQAFGVLTATSINKVAVTTPATGSTLTIADGKTLTVSNSLALAGTDATVQTFPSTSGTVVTSASVNAVTNAMRAQMAAYTLKGNSTGALANEADIDVTALTLKATPVAGDIVLIQDSAASNAFKKTTIGSLSAATGVASINGATGTLTGILTGTRLAKTAAYTVANADVGSSLALGGTALYAATFGPASGYTAPWAIRVVNEDSTRSKQLLTTVDVSTTSLAIGLGSKAFTITAGLDIPVGQRVRAWSASGNTNWMSGLVASYSGTTLTLTVDAIGGTGIKTDWQIGIETMLWPRQSVTIENQNNVWRMYGRTRWKAPNNVVVNIDAINGLETNDGLSTGAGGAVKTMNRGIRQIIKDEFDLSGISTYPTALVTVQLADNATAGVANANAYSLAHIAFTPVGNEGRCTILIKGNNSDPTKTVISDATGAAVGCYGSVNVELQDLQVGQAGAATPTANIGIQASDGANIRLMGGVYFGTCTDAQISVDNRGSIAADGNIVISGGASYFIFANDRGGVNLNTRTVTWIASSPYSQQTVAALGMSFVQLSSVSYVNTGNVTGARYFIRDQSTVRTDAGTPSTAIPGNASGSLSSGGQIL
ncbi:MULTISPECIES: hypothetical protein [unclassified Bradyrhizobium]|uniref:hypothetical protein n=1 Tax=unclassified Bradyrhizobium TaxID=2631580 RepID=UPI0029162EFE|nr:MULTISPECIES: hypothetical protein [unclassified Bradyrhizobium]